MKQILVSEELLRQVLEALEDGLHFRKTGLGRPPEQYNPPAIDALRTALEQPAVEPSTALRELACKYITEDEASESSINRLLTIGRKMADAISAAPQAQQPAAQQPAPVQEQFTRDELGLLRQWFNSMQDTNGGYIIDSDRKLFEKIVAALKAAPQAQQSVEEMIVTQWEQDLRKPMTRERGDDWARREREFAKAQRAAVQRPPADDTEGGAA